MLTWWGLFLLALSTGWGGWWSGIGALLITLMFIFISIPMIEKYTLQKRPEYIYYKRRTSMLLLFRPKK